MKTDGDLLKILRAEAPLTQCLTNYVSMDVAANVLLAAGASPAMVHAPEEAGSFARIAGAVSINIGTLSARWLDGMKAAVAGAREAGTPWVLDPVAHYASLWRGQAAADLLAMKPSILRANASEILALAGETSAASGADARDGVEAAEGAARRLATETGAVVAVTGEVDYLTDGARERHIAGGSPWMPKVTALGCALSALCGSFAAVERDAFAAAGAALSLYALAGARAHEQAEGPGSFRWRFLDALTAVTPDDLGAAA